MQRQDFLGIEIILLVEVFFQGYRHPSPLKLGKAQQAPHSDRFQRRSQRCGAAGPGPGRYFIIIHSGYQRVFLRVPRSSTGVSGLGVWFSAHLLVALGLWGWTVASFMSVVLGFVFLGFSQA